MAVRELTAEQQDELKSAVLDLYEVIRWMMGECMPEAPPHIVSHLRGAALSCERLVR